jgi:pyrroloquinoline quinone (PQQ) biosynthesis protein C
VEHFKSPFGVSDFASARAIENRRFFDDVLERAKSHRYFSHPFMTVCHETPSQELVTFVLTSTYQLVRPFTALLCALGGQAPNLHSRFALMDNIYEEMGCGDFESAHPRLYLKMLSSIGITEDVAEGMPVLPAIRRINDHLREVVEQRHFSAACAMLALAEAVIAPTFPVFVALARSAFPHVDMTFFDRHGPRDDGHSDDASTLFALSADRSQFATIEQELMLALDYRSDLFDEWMLVATRGLVRARPMASERPLRSLSDRPPRSRPLTERSRPLSERPHPLSERPLANRQSTPPRR